MEEPLPHGLGNDRVRRRGLHGAAPSARLTLRKFASPVLNGKFEKPYPGIANFAGVVAADAGRSRLFLHRDEKARLVVWSVVHLNKHEVPAKDRFVEIIPRFHDRSVERMSFRDTAASPSTMPSTFSPTRT